MARFKLRTLLCNSAILAIVIGFAPALRAQDSRVALPGTAAFAALPAAVSPVRPAASVVRASYSAQSYSTIHIPEAGAIKPIRQVSPESFPSRRKWLALSLASSAAAELDAYSTRRSLASGNAESNPLMRPFAGSPAIYAAIQVSPVVMDFAGFEMQRSRIPFIRHMWFIPQTTGTALSLFAASHNLRLSSR